MKTLAGIVLIAAVATVCDATWYSLGVRNMVATGVVYGVVLLTVVGAVLGATSGRLLRGLPIGAIAGIGGAVSYYAIVAVFGRRAFAAAIPASWVFMWLILAALDGRWLRAPARRPWAAVAGRGLAAAVFGGAAFYLVMNVLWGRPPEGGRNYAVQFLAWAFAWAPGLLAVTLGRPPAAAAPAARAPATRRDEPGAAPARDQGVEMDGSMTAVELLERIDRGETLHVLDVRSEHEFAGGHVPGAVNVPFMQVGARMGEVPGTPADPLVVYCEHGPRAYIAAANLRQGGRKIVYLSGHWSAWRAAGLPVQR
jgi:rhodanese-related sulfurtransferase